MRGKIEVEKYPGGDGKRPRPDFISLEHRWQINIAIVENANREPQEERIHKQEYEFFVNTTGIVMTTSWGPCKI